MYNESVLFDWFQYIIEGENMKWLHISDLHISDKTDWKVFKKDLLILSKKNGPIDLVIVTGDFHNYREVDDFSKAREFLDWLVGELNLDINSDLFLIPGNHDGTNPICKHKAGNIALLKEEPLGNHLLEWNELLSQFESYENFVKELIPQYPYEHPARIHHRVWKDKIDFLHCNSAVVSDDKEKSNQLLDLDSFAEIAQTSKYPSIVLVHNHFEDLHEQLQSRIKGIMRTSTIKAYFFGDTHKQQIHMISTRAQQNCQIPCVGCYKSAPEAEDTFSNIGVIVGTWVDEKATLAGWLWDVENSFQPDGIITGQTIDMGEPFENDNYKENNYAHQGLEIGHRKVRKKDEKPIPITFEGTNQNTNNLIEFRQLIFNMSDAQRKQVNDKLPYGIRDISENETLESINQYWKEINQYGYGDNYLELIRKVYGEV